MKAAGGMTVRVVVGRCKVDLKDITLLRLFLLKLVEKLGLTAVSNGRGGRCEAKIYPGGGVSAIRILKESHAAIHTWPEEDAADVVVHSCRPINCSVIEFHCLDDLGAGEILRRSSM